MSGAGPPSQDPAPVVGRAVAEDEGPGPLRRLRTAALWWGTSADASGPLTGLAAAALTAPLYWGWLRPLAGTRTGELLYHRGAIPYAVVFMALWALLILALKLRNVAAQRSALAFALFPATEGRIRPGGLADFRARLARLPFPPRRSWLFRRVSLALEHFEARGQVEEVGAFLSAQADIDAARVDSSYVLSRVLIWAIPILGFIGTVVGIGAAVEGFSGGVAGAADVETIQAALGRVTSGLATAFDTTLVALVVSVLVMFPTNALQKAEEGVLTRVDEVCQEELLARLDGADEHPDVVAARVTAAFEAALARHTEALRAALAELAAGSGPAGPDPEAS